LRGVDEFEEPTQQGVAVVAAQPELSAQRAQRAQTLGKGAWIVVDLLKRGILKYFTGGRGPWSPHSVKHEGRVCDAPNVTDPALGGRPASGFDQGKPAG
jgi:hypothetical protein